MKKKTSIFLLALMATVISVHALEPGSRYTPHQYQQNDWFLDYGENTAQYVNPASIAENDQIEASLGWFATLGGKAGQEFLSIVHPFDYNHSAGFTVFENGASLGENVPSYVENAYQLGYAYRLGPKLPLSHQIAVGANLSVIQFNLFDIKGFQSYGIDLGLSYNPVFSSKFGHWQFGLAVQNLLQPKVESVSSDGQSYKVPLNLNPSIFWRGPKRRLECAASLSLVDVFKDHYDTPRLFPSVRAIYYLGPMIGLKAKFSKQQYFVLGGTVNVKWINLFRYLQFDLDLSHSKLSLGDDGQGVAFNLKAVTRIGPTREERIGAARYRRLKLEPEDAYREAMRLYLARKFLLASYAFGKVITKYPAFHLVDLAAFYKGKSFENLRMHTAAQTVYNRAIKKYSMSDAKPRYIFQLMNIDYKEGRYSEAAEKYQIISNLYRETDVKPDADYVMGQIRFVQEDFTSSIRLLTPILPGNANYIYARYTMAMAYFKIKKTKEAVACLKDITDVSPSNISEQELQDISQVKLGHLSFDAEPPEFKAAVDHYSQVAPTSTKYDEALLGLAWTFLRLNKPQETARAVTDLINNYPNSFLVGEAHLLMGYCHYFEKQYDKALSEFDLAVEKSNAQAVSPDEISKKTASRRETDQKFQDVQKRALSLSDQIPSARVLQRRDELRPEFDLIHEEIEAYIEFQHYVDKSNRFLNNRERVIRDAKFTKATVRNIMQTRDEQRGPSQKDINELDVD